MDLILQFVAGEKLTNEVQHSLQIEVVKTVIGNKSIPCAGKTFEGQTYSESEGNNTQE